GRVLPRAGRVRRRAAVSADLPLREHPRRAQRCRRLQAELEHAGVQLEHERVVDQEGMMRLRSFAVALLGVTCFAPAVHAQETPRMGGVLRVAIVGEPPSLDIPMPTPTLTYELMWHVDESLFAY